VAQAAAQALTLWHCIDSGTGGGNSDSGGNDPAQALALMKA